jgi:hypothetical protein
MADKGGRVPQDSLIVTHRSQTEPAGFLISLAWPGGRDEALRAPGD